MSEPGCSASRFVQAPPEAFEDLGAGGGVAARIGHLDVDVGGVGDFRLPLRFTAGHLLGEFRGSLLGTTGLA